MPASHAGPRGNTWAARINPSSSCHDTQSYPCTDAWTASVLTIIDTRTQSDTIRNMGNMAMTGTSTMSTSATCTDRFMRGRVLGMLNWADSYPSRAGVYLAP